MKRRAFLLSAGACFVVSGAPVSSQPYPDRIVDITNDARSQFSRSPLMAADRLNRAAMEQAMAMARAETLSHTVAGMTLRQRMENVAITRGWMSENIAKYPLSYVDDQFAQTLVQGWMDSRPHRKNILYRDARATGVALAQQGDWVYAAQVLWGPA
ncbi:MAG: hypothetical protein HRU32_10560 [Rhodobacteraceae bacterium]|nr:hypothetical protein [Paracoccaceae bacterium]